MGLHRLAEWKVDAEYFREQVRAVLDSLGIDIAGETYKEFLCYCPFHGNRHTPAFSINKTSGLYMCHNASCPASSGGNIEYLVMRLGDKSPMAAKRYIMKKGGESQVPVEDILNNLLKAEERFPTLPMMKVEELVENFWNHEPAIDYMHNRGFNDDTLKTFYAGWEPEEEMVVVPVADHTGNFVGVNGRSIEGKRHKLSKRIPKKKILFNLDNAKKIGGTVVVAESQFDAMMVHQAGYKNVVALLGSHASPTQIELLNRYFERVIIMTDADKAGRAAGRVISAGLRNMRVEWAVWDYGEVFPHGATDPGEMTEAEIQQCIKNAISNLDYEMYKELDR